MKQSIQTGPRLTAVYQLILILSTVCSTTTRRCTTRCMRSIRRISECSERRDSCDETFFYQSIDVFLPADCTACVPERVDAGSRHVYQLRVSRYGDGGQNSNEQSV